MLGMRQDSESRNHRKATTGNADINIAAQTLLEANYRLSANPNDYYSSRKVFMNLRNQTMNVEGQFRNFSKPDYLRVSDQPQGGDADPENLGNRSVLSKFAGWITIDEKTNLTRKNAPEVVKNSLNEKQLMRFKPSWMEKKFETNSVMNLEDLQQDLEPAGKLSRQRPGTTRSVFEVGSYRHHFNTKVQFDNNREDHLKKSESTYTTRPAGIKRNGWDEIVNAPSSMLKWLPENQQRNRCISSYDLHRPRGS